MLIESQSNPTVKLLRSLDLPRNIEAQSMFVVEGVRALEDALTSGHAPRILLYNRDLLSRTDRGRALLKQIDGLSRRGPDLLVAETSERALEAASGTQHPQGLIAAFSIIKWPRLGTGAAIKSGFLGLVCDSVQDPGNLGTILRTAEAAGAACVWLSQGCAHPYAPKVVRAAMGAHFRLPLYPHTEWPALQAELGSAELPAGRIFATDSQASEPYDKVDWLSPAVLIVSNEAHGLSEGARQFLRSSQGSAISIPMSGGAESLNASIAAAVVLFEAARQRRASHPENKQ